jgi:NADPH:quinone reductase-like Zn-dependent oxidoreductase
MRAAFVTHFDADAPLDALTIGDRPEPELPGRDWVPVRVAAASLNHHDLWSLRGVGLDPRRLPMTLGCDAAGYGPDGEEVVVHAVIDGPTGDGRGYSLLSEYHQGTLADLVAVPRANLVTKPPELSFAQAACLPTAWLTAYRMLVGRGRLAEGDAVLVQGAGGGVATAAVLLAVALGARVYATSRSAGRRERIAALGATAVEPGGRLPERVDVVIETVGTATFDHSLKCAREGARIVVSGATAGHLAEVNLRRIFALQLEVLGSSMGSRDDLTAVLRLCATRGLRPVVESAVGFDGLRDGFARLAGGQVFGKVVLEPGA